MQTGFGALDLLQRAAERCAVLCGKAKALTRKAKAAEKKEEQLTNWTTFKEELETRRYAAAMSERKTSRAMPLCIKSWPRTQTTCGGSSCLCMVTSEPRWLFHVPKTVSRW